MKSRLKVIRINRFAQNLVKEWLLFGRIIFSKTLATEEIPSHAAICLACFGDTGGWISKFAPFNSNGVKEGIWTR